MADAPPSVSCSWSFPVSGLVPPNGSVATLLSPPSLPTQDVGPFPAAFAQGVKQSHVTTLFSLAVPTRPPGHSPPLEALWPSPLVGESSVSLDSQMPHGDTEVRDKAWGQSLAPNGRPPWRHRNWPSGRHSWCFSLLGLPPPGAHHTCSEVGRLTSFVSRSCLPPRRPCLALSSATTRVSMKGWQWLQGRMHCDF